MVEELEDKSVERPVNTQFLRRFSKTDVSATLPRATSVLRGCKFFLLPNNGSLMNIGAFFDNGTFASPGNPV